MQGVGDPKRCAPLDDRIALRLAPAKVEVERSADGTLILRSPQKLLPYRRCVTEWLLHWAARNPEHVFLAERDNQGWHTLSYRQTTEKTLKIGAGLLSAGLDSEHPFDFPEIASITRFSRWVRCMSEFRSCRSPRPIP
jgi:hypothetical protein